MAGEPATLPPPPLVAVSVNVPTEGGVYVNVFAVDDADQDSDVGAIVPPAPPSLKVTVSVAIACGVIVKFDDVPTPACEVEPVSV